MQNYLTDSNFLTRNAYFVSDGGQEAIPIEFYIFKMDELTDDIIERIKINPDDFPKYYEDYNKHITKKEPDSYLILAKSESDITLGFAIVEKDKTFKKSIIISSIESRAQGIGTLIYAKIFNYFKKLGYNVVCASDASLELDDEQTINKKILDNIRIGKKNFLRYSYPQDGCNAKQDQCQGGMNEDPFPFCIDREVNREEYLEKKAADAEKQRLYDNRKAIEEEQAEVQAKEEEADLAERIRLYENRKNKLEQMDLADLEKLFDLESDFENNESSWRDDIDNLSDFLDLPPECKRMYLIEFILSKEEIDGLFGGEVDLLDFGVVYEKERLDCLSKEKLIKILIDDDDDDDNDLASKYKSELIGMIIKNQEEYESD